MRMTRWHVYEFCKTFYMKTGIMPTALMVIDEFLNIKIDSEEITEGFKEFQTTCGGKADMSKIKGVAYHSPTNKWRVYRREKDGKRKWVGHFGEKEEAIEAARPYQESYKRKKRKKRKKGKKIIDKKESPFRFEYFCKRLEPGEKVEVGSLLLLEDGGLYIATKVDMRNGRAFGKMEATTRRFDWQKISPKLICI